MDHDWEAGGCMTSGPWLQGLDAGTLAQLLRYRRRLCVGAGR